MSGALAGRVVVVTGASRGIGRAAAMAIGAAGGHVIAIARTTGALEELDDALRAQGSEGATLVPVDLSDSPAIDRLGAAIAERWGRLDGLVGAAGSLGLLTPLAHLEPKTFDEVMGVNVMANWRLIRSLDPLLRAAQAGRAVFVTSGAAQSCRPFWGAYSVSKAALDALVKTYAAEIATTRARANLFSPGATRTVMRAKAMPGEDPSSLPTPETVAAALVPLLFESETRNGETIRFSRPS